MPVSVSAVAKAHMTTGDTLLHDAQLLSLAQQLTTRLCFAVHCV